MTKKAKAEVRTNFSARDIRKAMNEANREIVGRIGIVILGSAKSPGIKNLLNRKDNRTGLTPSRPGQPPAKVTGTLARSWRTSAKKGQRRGSKITLQVGSDVAYARRLEREMDRPYVQPTLKNRQVLARIGKEIASVAKRTQKKLIDSAKMRRIG